MLKYFSAYAENLTYEALPKAVVHETKRRVIDTFGCALGAYNMVPPKIAPAQALEVTASPAAAVLGTNRYSSTELAAFANGVTVRHLDFNDASHGKANGHPGDNIQAGLTAAEYAGDDTHTFITGIVLAHEKMDR